MLHTLSAPLAFFTKAGGAFFFEIFSKSSLLVVLHFLGVVSGARAAYGGSIPPTDTCLGGEGSLLQSKLLAGAKGKVSPCPHVACAPRVRERG